jgi:TonB family protein
MKQLAFAAVLLFSATAAAQNQVYKPGPGIKEPEVLKETKPSYTAAAMRAKIQGSVEMELTVGVDGKPADIRVVRSLDKVYGLDDKAIEAVSKWVFKPGMREGKPVPVRVTILMTFTLRDGPRVFDKTNPEVAAPVLVVEKKPSYTPEAMRNRIEGSVELEGTVQTDGRVTDIRVVKGLEPGLDANAIDAFKGYTFKPAALGSRQVPYRIKVEFTFKLR